MEFLVRRLVTLQTQVHYIAYMPNFNTIELSRAGSQTVNQE